MTDPQIDDEEPLVLSDPVFDRTFRALAIRVGLLLTATACTLGIATVVILAITAGGCL